MADNRELSLRSLEIKRSAHRQPGSMITYFHPHCVKFRFAVDLVICNPMSIVVVGATNTPPAWITHPAFQHLGTLARDAQH